MLNKLSFYEIDVIYFSIYFGYHINREEVEIRDRVEKLMEI